jgi:hypothetical protein
MVTRRKHFGPLFVVFALLIACSTLIETDRGAYAAGSRPVTSGDWGDFSGSENGAGNAIAGVTYKQAVLLAFNNSYITLYPGKFPGYAALTVAVGIPDGSTTNHPGTETITFTKDGTLFKKITKSYGQLATMVTVPFGKASQIKIQIHDNQKQGFYIVLGNPTVVATVPKAVATPEPIAGGNGGNSGTTGGGSTTGKTTLKLFSSTVSAGGQETALITAGHGAELTVVITYPNGSQLVLGPKKAGADGNFAYTWTIPAGVKGKVHITVVSYSTVASSTFTVQ